MRIKSQILGGRASALSDTVNLAGRWLQPPRLTLKDDIGLSMLEKPGMAGDHTRVYRSHYPRTRNSPAHNILRSTCFYTFVLMSESVSCRGAQASSFPLFSV